jgi:hypothetical protein
MQQCQTLAGYNSDFREINEPKGYNRTYSAVRVEYVSADRLEKSRALLEQFNSENRLFTEMITALPTAEDRIKRAINTISAWDFSRALLEITGDGNAVFKIHLAAHKTVYVGLNLNEEGYNDSYFSYYEDATCKRNGVGSFSEVVTALANQRIL